MSDWPGNNEKMTSFSNFKLSFLEKPWDELRGFNFNLV